MIRPGCRRCVFWHGERVPPGLLPIDQKSGFLFLPPRVVTRRTPRPLLICVLQIPYQIL